MFVKINFIVWYIMAFGDYVSDAGYQFKRSVPCRTGNQR